MRTRAFHVAPPTTTTRRALIPRHKEQGLGRNRSINHYIKTSYTIIYNEPVEDEKTLKRDTPFLLASS